MIDVSTKMSCQQILRGTFVTASTFFSFSSIPRAELCFSYSYLGKVLTWPNNMTKVAKEKRKGSLKLLLNVNVVI